MLAAPPPYASMSLPYSYVPTFPIPSFPYPPHPPRDQLITAPDVTLEHKHRIGCGALVLTLLVLIVTFGAGFGILVWLYAKRKISLAKAFRTGYILADEGVEGEVESATLRALTAISFIVR
jgi:hypothetical protein